MLRNIHLFDDLDDAQRAQLQSLAETVNFKKGDIVIHQGEHSDSLYIILYGQLKVLYTDEDGNQTMLAVLGDRDFFGELSLLDSRPRSATVQAMQDSRVLRLNRQHILKFIEQSPGASMAMMQAMADRVRVLDETFCRFSHLDIYGRILEALKRVAKKEGDHLVTPRLTQQDIADLVGASREMVNRTLRELKEAGEIKVDGKQFFLLKS